MICSIIDGSTSLETGKAPEVGRDEEVLLGHRRQPLVKLTLVGQLTSNASRWCSDSKYQHPFDADLPAIIELLSIMHRFTEAIRRVGFMVKLLAPSLYELLI